MVLLYMTSQQNADALDEECAAKGILIKKITGHFSLNRFVVQDGSGLGSFSYLAIDLSAVKDGEDEIVQALNGFRAMHSAQVIVVAHGMAENDPFLVRLRGEGVRCVVNAAEVVPERAPPIDEPVKEPIPEPKPVQKLDPVPVTELIIESALKTSSPIEPIPVPDPMSAPAVESKHKPKPKPMRRPKPIPIPEPEPVPIREAIKEPLPEPTPIPVPELVPVPLPQPVLSPPHQTISIGICGAIHRIGTTTQALNLAVYLSRHGYKVCVVESNAHGHYGQLAGFYGMKLDEKNRRISHNGIDLYLQYDLSAINRVGYTATVFDYGMFEEMDAHSFFTRDVKIICTGAKAWESSALGEVFAACGGRNDLHFMFSFVPQEEQRDIKRLMGKYADNTHFSAYLPSLFEPMPNAGVYRTILAPFIQPATAQQSEPPRKGLLRRR